MNDLATYDKACAVAGVTAVRALLGADLAICERDELAGARAINGLLRAELAAYQFDGDRKLPTRAIPPRPIRDYSAPDAAAVSDAWVFGGFVGGVCGFLVGMVVMWAMTR